VTESNARVVEWSDGSKSLAIGDEFFDMEFSKVTNSILTLKHEDLMLMKTELKDKAILKPSKTGLKVREASPSPKKTMA
jgi:RNA polymerase-associated protein LEO1